MTALRRDLGLVIAAWAAAVGVDLLLHAGLLAPLYRDGGPFLLPALEAFRRIPIGYASFLVLTGLVWWVCETLDLRTWTRGLRAGAVLGWTVWGALTLGLYSISTASPSLLVGWWLGQGAEMGVSGALIALGRGGRPRRRVYLISAGIVAGCVVITVLLQSLGPAPPMERVAVRPALEALQPVQHEGELQVEAIDPVLQTPVDVAVLFETHELPRATNVGHGRREDGGPEPEDDDGDQRREKRHGKAGQVARSKCGPTPAGVAARAVAKLMSSSKDPVQVSTA